MIPYNPCGAVVDFGRFRYRTRFKPFKDSDVEAEIIWYEALPDAVCLPYESAISQIIWDRELVTMDPQHVGVGEVPGALKTISHFKAVPGADGRHVCGTREDFEEGAVYDPDRPPIPYREDGLPVCCLAEEDVGALLLGGTGYLVFPGQGTLDMGGNPTHGWSLSYYITSEFASQGVSKGFGPADDRWFGSLGGFILYGPNFTEIPGRWFVTCDGSLSGSPIARWGTTNWSGWGDRIFEWEEGEPAGPIHVIGGGLP